MHESELAEELFGGALKALSLLHQLARSLPLTQEDPVGDDHWTHRLAQRNLRCG